MKNLKEIRIDRGMTQVEVARAVGVSIGAYVKWEQQVMNPNEENEKKLKEVLKIK
jgi:transcriptional regulator with XRE-family HTH domain